MNCKRCGESITTSTKFCPNCGLENPAISWKSSTAEPAYANTAQATSTKTTSAQSSTAVAEKKSGGIIKTIITLAVLVIVGVIIYNFVTNHGLKGTWYADSDSRYSITFSDRKNGYIHDGSETINFTYTVSGKEVTIYTEKTLYRNSVVEKFKFKVSGKKLTLTDSAGITETFHK